MGLATSSNTKEPATAKRLLTPANFYIKEQLKPYMEQHKVDTKTALGIISSHYKNLAPDHKARYEDMAKKQPGYAERAQAKGQKEKARPLSAYNIFVQSALKVGAQPFAVGSLGCRKGFLVCGQHAIHALYPPHASLLYSVAQYLALPLHYVLQKLKDGGMSHADAFKAVPKEWKGLSEDQKRPFQQAHEKAVKEWEQRTGKQYKKASK
jgi:hypothetical protein